MRYIGLDLAWGERNTTGAAVLESLNDNPRSGATLTATADDLLTDDDVLDFVRTHDDAGGLLIGIDAPLTVPNLTGKRFCEAILSACLRKQEAGPHPANRTLLAGTDGTVRGERLAARLNVALGIAHAPHLETLAPPVRVCFEVFPHPAHIALFDLPKTLKYKARPKRDLQTRLAEFRRYAQLLESLRGFDPPLFLPEGDDFWLRRDPEGLSKPSSKLKKHEDAMDAVSCAYIALYRHRWGNEKCPVIGDEASGYIVTPANQATQACFLAAKNNRKRNTVLDT